MIDNYLENVNTLDQQVEINKKDIENLKTYIQEAYKCNIPLEPEPQSISLNSTNAPAGTDKGWLIDTQGNLFKIVGSETIGTTLLVIVYYTNIKGPKGEMGPVGVTGVGITGIEEIGDEIVGNQTLTTLRVYFSNGTNDEIIVYAENGKGNMFVPIELVSAETINGTITQEQLNLLKESDSNYIVTNYNEHKEKYYLNTEASENGFLTYIHIENENGSIKIKALTITESVLSWVITELSAGGGALYEHNINLSFAGGHLTTKIITRNNIIFTIEQMAQYLYNNNLNKSWIVYNCGANILYIPNNKTKIRVAGGLYSEDGLVLKAWVSDKQFSIVNNAIEISGTTTSFILDQTVTISDTIIEL